jgi:hypothetical protein
VEQTARRGSRIIKSPIRVKKESQAKVRQQATDQSEISDSGITIE